MIKENRAFMEMLKVARQWLSDKEPLEIAKKTGIAYDEENACFHLQSMGTEIYIHYPDYKIEPFINEWHQLVILHYMNLADGTELAKKWMSMGEMKNGLVRGGDFDLRCENVISERLSQISADEFLEKCQKIGGTVVDSNADITIQFDLLPYYPVLFKLWLADEEFKASGKLLVDASADHYLTIEDSVTVGQVIIEALVGVF